VKSRCTSCMKACYEGLDKSIHKCFEYCKVLCATANFISGTL
jgi:hypothetical protein